MEDQLIPAERERLCAALDLHVYRIFQKFDRGWRAALHPDEVFRAADEAQDLADDLTGEFRVESEPPPIDTDPAWALKAMETACDRTEWLEFLVSNGDGRWLVYVKREGNIHGYGKNFPLALCRALLAAIDAGVLS